ncbi:MAG: hypothetical protein WD648_01140 [Planctomycetaceae bacterium]
MPDIPAMPPMPDIADTPPRDTSEEPFDDFLGDEAALSDLGSSEPIRPIKKAAKTSSKGGERDKQSVSSFLDFFDFGFKRYLTPCIVRHVWLWAVCLMGLGLMIQVAMYFYKSLPSRYAVSLPIPFEAQMRKSCLDDLIRKEEMAEVRKAPEAKSPRENIRPAPPVAPTREPEANLCDEYSKMTVSQLKAERKSLDKKFPETGTRWKSWSIFYLAAAAAAVFATILTLVILRVCCEMLIVVFNIAASLTVIAANTARSGKSPRD